MRRFADDSFNLGSLLFLFFFFFRDFPPPFFFFWVFLLRRPESCLPAYFPFPRFFCSFTFLPGGRAVLFPEGDGRLGVPRAVLPSLLPPLQDRRRRAWWGREDTPTAPQHFRDERALIRLSNTNTQLFDSLKAFLLLLFLIPPPRLTRTTWLKPSPRWWRGAGGVLSALPRAGSGGGAVGGRRGPPGGRGLRLDGAGRRRPRPWPGTGGPRPAPPVRRAGIGGRRHMTGHVLEAAQSKRKWGLV